MTLHGLASYRNTAVSIDENDKGSLLIKVFQRILEKLEIIGIHIESRNFEKRYEEISKIRQVLEILYDSVDVQYGEISQNLQGLYLYIIKRLDEANLKNDKNAVDECKSLIKTIYVGFEEAYEKEKENCSENKKNIAPNDCFVEINNKEVPPPESPGRAYAGRGYL